MMRINEFHKAMSIINWIKGTPTEPGRYFELVFDKGIEWHLPFWILPNRPELIRERTYCHEKDYPSELLPSA